MEGFLLKSLKSSVLWVQQEKLAPRAKRAGGLRPWDTGSWEGTGCSARDHGPEHPCPGSGAPGPVVQTKCALSSKSPARAKNAHQEMKKMVKRSHLQSSCHARVEHSEPQSHTTACTACEGLSRLCRISSRRGRSAGRVSPRGGKHKHMAIKCAVLSTNICVGATGPSPARRTRCFRVSTQAARRIL